MALSITNTQKNIFLDALVKATSATYGWNIAPSSIPTFLKIKNAGGTSINSSGGTTMLGAWSTVVAGTSTLTLSVTPSATDTAALMSIYSQALGADVATGTTTASGGGGNIIVPSVSFVNATPQTVTAVLKVPTIGGGTMNFNQALATAFANTILNNTSNPGMASAGVITFYNGTQPATADTAISGQTVLGTYTFATADYSTAASGQSVLAASKTITVTGTGTAQFFRWVKGSYVIDGTVGTTGADCIVDTTAFVASNNRTMTALTLTMP